MIVSTFPFSAKYMIFMVVIMEWYVISRISVVNSLQFNFGLSGGAKSDTALPII